jgi:hypothetical protein
MGDIGCWGVMQVVALRGEGRIELGSSPIYVTGTRTAIMSAVHKVYARSILQYACLRLIPRRLNAASFLDIIGRKAVYADHPCQGSPDFIYAKLLWISRTLNRRMRSMTAEQMAAGSKDDSNIEEIFDEER